MFSAEDLKVLEPKYFSIITVSDYDVTIMSRNTGHIWYIHNPEYPGEGTCIIFHKHKASHPYHQHGRANTLKCLFSYLWMLATRASVLRSLDYQDR